MTCKTIEILDRATFVPALAIRLDPADERDRYLLARAGYGTTDATQRSYVLLLPLQDAPHDPYEHSTARTLRVAHLHLIDNFDRVDNGAVLDVEYIAGEVPTPKRSEADRVGQ